jgi:cellobiose-specific phosphotransferase system component IIB
MKTILILCAGFCAAMLASGFAAETKTKPNMHEGKLRHVVAFKFKPSATKEQIKQVEDAFRDLKKKVTEIQSYEWGINNSPENKNRGCTHGFILTFNSEKDRDAYLIHPQHKEFGKLVGPLLDDVFVIDFWAKE